MFSLPELIDMVVMILVIGFIFKDVFPRKPKVEILMPEDYLHRSGKYKWDDFWFAVAVVGPSIILHEFGHKFVALFWGLSATFHAAYTWLFIGLMLKVLGFPFIFFVPAYVSIAGAGTPLEMAAVAFAGPAINLILWLGSSFALKRFKLKKDWHHFFYLTSKINMFLFFFNMIPLPGFDGASFFANLFSGLF